ncbi:methyl-accepting chemotaxis protein [Halosolutus gelatinilyticus]|uniref:methyl-accepting chemotaxis protein n=1 Tax=Halosolutus gelatinilyticus TaxID=2931975 RepID=UPI001FF6BBA2|nr:methyl-accepting chemotaxis protein [Halosolutus gelatinilyticus]
MGFNPAEYVPGVRRSYALRFVAALVAVVVVLGAFGGYVYAHTGDELESDVASQLVSGAEKDSDRLDTWYDSTERYMESLPRSTAFRSEDTVAISDALHRLTDRAAFEGGYYVDPATGEVLVSAGVSAVADERRLNDATADRVAAAMDDGSSTAFTEPFEIETGRPAMLVVSKVPGSDRAVVGLVDLGSLSRYMIGDEEDDVVVVDSSGTVVLAHDRALLLRDDVLDPADVGDGTGTASIETAAGDELVVGYAALESTDWTLTTRVPAAKAYSLQTVVSNGILAMLAVALASVVVLGATIGRTTARSLRDLSGKAKAIEGGTLDDPVESTRSDELGDLHRSLDRMRRSLRDRIEEAESARADAERARAESDRFSRHLERTADEYGEIMRACADGDLTRRLEPDGESEAMAAVAAEFNAMMDDIERTVGVTRAFADAVDDAAETTADGVVEVRSASEQVTTSVQQIADGADRQSDQLAAVSAEVDDLSTATEEIAATSSRVASLAGRTAETGSNARESAQRAIDGMNAVETEADEAVAEVDRLEREMAEIDDLLALIEAVAVETNMLALNASIEASRSDSSAGGFTAVAEQVKSLAEETQEAATEIEDRLERVDGQTDRVVEVVRKTNDRIETHRGAVEKSVAALDEISSFAAETNRGVQEISTASQQQAAATQQVVAMTDDVTAISEETSAEAETVAAAAEEQTSSLVEVSHTAASLSERAGELSESLSTFEVSIDPSAADGDESESADTTARSDDEPPDSGDEPNAFTWSE